MRLFDWLLGRKNTVPVQIPERVSTEYTEHRDDYGGITLAEGFASAAREEELDTPEAVYRSDKRILTEQVVKDFRKHGKLIPVPKWTHPGKEGKDIYCPECAGKHHVGHFAWSALMCSDCFATINKYEWLIVKKRKTKKTKKREKREKGAIPQL